MKQYTPDELKQFGGVAICGMSDLPMISKGYVLAVINERLGWHRDNLAGWREGTGYLCPTEPDLDERRRVRAHLGVAIDVLTELRTALGLENFPCPQPNKNDAKSP